MAASQDSAVARAVVGWLPARMAGVPIITASLARRSHVVAALSLPTTPRLLHQLFAPGPLDDCVRLAEEIRKALGKGGGPPIVSS